MERSEGRKLRERSGVPLRETERVGALNRRKPTDPVWKENRQTQITRHRGSVWSYRPNGIRNEPSRLERLQQRFCGGSSVPRLRE